MEIGLRIRVLEGQTVDGRTEYEFPASPNQPEELIVVGRDPRHCRIVFVNDLRHRGLGSEHIGFRRSLGRYVLDLNTEDPVLVDGKAAFEEKELRGTHTLRLGDAVKLEVTVVDDRPATIGVRQAAQLPEVTLRTRRLLAGLAATVAALAVGGWWGMREQEIKNQKSAELVAQAVENAAVPADALERAARSVYLIVKKSDAGGEDAIGTGWSGPGGVIVTNAHIAEDIPESSDDEHWVVRSSVPPYREHAVKACRIHPGYDAFSEFVGAIKPVQETISSYAGVGRAQACDVALLEVADSDTLMPALEVASRSELAALKAGDAVATVGFPDEGLASTPVFMAAPVPTRHRGFLVRITDFFLREREDGENQLVQHGLPAAGGSSGSPIIDSRGVVVALISGGNVLGLANGGRIVSNVVSFGQRADLVLDLLEKSEAEHLSHYHQMWTASLADFQRESDVHATIHFRETAALLGRTDVKPRPREEMQGEAIVAESKEDLEKCRPIVFDLPPGVFSVRVLAKNADNTSDIDCLVFDSGASIVADDTSPSLGAVMRIVNIHPQAYKLIGWVPGGESAVPFTCVIYDWRCEADEYFVRKVVRDVQSYYETQDVPAFEAETESGSLSGRDGSSGRCELKLKIAKPGVYAAIGRASEPVRFAMSLTSGGKTLDANSAAPSGGDEGSFCDAPIIVFEVDRTDADVRFSCMSGTLGPDAAARVDARLIGWPGLMSREADK